MLLTPGLISLVILSAGPLLPQLSRAGFDPAGDLITARSYHTATLLPDGRVFVAGGAIDKDPYLTNKAEIYDPATNKWTPTGSMSVARYDHGAVLLPDGRVLVAGGVELGFNPIKSAEIYDPAAGTWSSIENMIQRRDLFALVLLPNGGGVLAAGGLEYAMGHGGLSELYRLGTGHWRQTGGLAAHELFSRHAATLGRGVGLRRLLEWRPGHLLGALHSTAGQMA